MFGKFVGVLESQNAVFATALETAAKVAVYVSDPASVAELSKYLGNKVVAPLTDAMQAAMRQRVEGGVTILAGRVKVATAPLHLFAASYRVQSTLWHDLAEAYEAATGPMGQTVAQTVAQPTVEAFERLVKANEALNRESLTPAAPPSAPPSTMN